MNFDTINSDIKPVDKTAIENTEKAWDRVAKPIGSLGLLEDIIIRIAGMTGGDLDLKKRAVVVLCADNGITEENIAGSPADVTAIMADIISQKRSSVCRMANTAGADSIAVDIGMFRRIETDKIIDRHIRSGTNNMAKGPAMTKNETIQAIQTGMDIVRDCKEQGYKIIATGEMGIGNTTTSSAMSAILLDKDASDITGPGAGLSEEGLVHKMKMVEKAIQENKPDRQDPLDILSKLGGFDIAGMCGIFLGGALERIPIIIDGVISSVSALTAIRLCPAAKDYMLASHLSIEPAAASIMDELGLKPPIRGEMRLGEGTGAVTLFPLIDMALAVYNEAATYSDIGM